MIPQRTSVVLSLALISPAAAREPQHPFLTIDRSILQDDIVVVGSSSWSRGHEPITETILAPSISLSDATRGLVGDTPQIAKGIKAQREVDTAVERATRAALVMGRR